MSQPNEKQTQPIITHGTPTLNDWKVYLRNLQQIPVQHSMAARDSSSSESSFELDVSFKALLERKRQEMQEKACEDHFLSDGDGVSRAAPPVAAVSGNDSTFLEQDSISKISDTSFEEMERICAVVDKVNGYDTIGGIGGDEEKEKVFEPSPSTPGTLPGSLVGDVTQLEDIDEPSGLWENTILPGAAGATNLSPVKRMHLLRPSTILEETTISSSAEASKNSSIDTFISAKQGAEEESAQRNSAISGSEVYRTAQDTFGTDSYARSSILDMDSGVTSDITAAENHTKLEDESAYSKNSTREAGEEEESLLEEQVIINLDSSSSDVEEEQPEQWCRDTAHPLESMMVSEREEESLLERDDSRSLYNALGETTENYTCEEESVLDEIPDHFNDTLEETDFMLRQGMKIMALKQKEKEEEERRKEEDSQQSYLYGRQQQQQQAVKSRTNSDSDDGSSRHHHHQLHTPNDKNVKKGPTVASHMSYLTPTGGGTHTKTVSHGLAGSAGKQALFSSTGKNVQKYTTTSGGGGASGGSFKKPVSRVPQLRVPTVRKFDHIVSPISAYIKNTPQSMLQSKIPCHNKNLIDMLHSENRDSAASSSAKENQHGGGGGVNLKGYTSVLPVKGVVSSRRAHVLDERNVMRIPGGEKMQKLINNSPTMIIRHEGRIKYAERSTGQERNNVSVLTDDSLADLSVMSSDVSVRVLKDAQRYN